MNRSAAARFDTGANEAVVADLRVVARNDDLPSPIADGRDVSHLLSLLQSATDHVLDQKRRADTAEARLDVAIIRLKRAEDRADLAEARLGESEIRAGEAERRAEDLERNLRRAGLAVVEAENRLQRAITETREERERASEVQRSSAKTVERMRLLLNEASDRLRRATAPA